VKSITITTLIIITKDSGMVDALYCRKAFCAQ